MEEPTVSQIDHLIEIVRRLRAPDGCPWDREQTHESLRPGLLEEAYEVLDALDSGDKKHFEEELGDLLLQVVMHSQIATESGGFDFNAVTRHVAEKLVRRHPHVFGDGAATDTADVLRQWEAIKRSEKGAVAQSRIDGVAQTLPALMRAQKIQKKAARSRFDWGDAEGALQKIEEEVAEVRAAIAGGVRADIDDEIGDLLFSVVNLARKTGGDAELLLKAATDKFSKRFQAMENQIAASGREWDRLSLEQLDAVWDQVKLQETGHA